MILRCSGRALRCSVLLATLLFIFIPLVPALAQNLRDVRIEGAQRIESDTIISYMGVPQGQPITQETLDTALKNLFRTGLFADVAVSQQGDAIIVRVVENPLVNKIAFEGNDKIKDAELEGEISLRPREVLTQTKVQSDVDRIYQLYRRNGRFTVFVDPKIIKLDQNRVNLVYEITEGDVSDVAAVRFVGNEHFEDDELRGVISTRESRWYRFMTTSDRYDPDRLAYDQEMLRRFYLEKGYADFKIVSTAAELSEDKKNFYLTMTVDEGERYKFGTVGVNSQLRNFNGDQLKPAVTFGQGDWYNADQVQDTIQAMTDQLQDMQYAFVSVKPVLRRNRENKTVDIAFQINETPRVYVERIDINGNMRTHDNVIRREFDLVEGDPFNRSKIAKAEQNLKDLDYFEKVEVKTAPGAAPDKTVVDVDVAEKSTGELSVGAGFSTADGPLADFRIRERNFLGKGQDLTLASTIAGKRTEFDVAFTEPYFMGRDLSAGVDAFHITRDLQDESSYDQRRTGGALRLGYPLSEKWRQTLRYRLENNDIRDVDEDASLFIRQQEGKRLTSAVSQRLVYDNRDSSLFPTEGLTSWVETEFAGLGGDAEYVSGTVGASYYYPVLENWILNVLGETGAITGWGDEDVAINERFNLGGNSLRGFESAGIGPRDLDTDDALGGNLFYRGTAELSFPVGLPEEYGVKGHAFSDFGSLWDVDNTAGGNVADDGSLRVSAGVGASWRSPFGPIKVDFGFPVVKEDYDQEENFRFSFGTRF